MRRAVALAALTMAMTLSGCAGVGENALIAVSGIGNDSVYQQYQSLAQEGKLNEDGYYTDPSILPETADTDTVSPGQIHVTFGENNYLSLTYYQDAALTEPLDPDACYLNPGDCIYAAEPEVDNPNSSLYHLSEFRLRTYDDTGAQVEEEKSTLSSHLVYQIPETYEGTELSVLPVGIYEKQTLSLDSFYVDDSGTSQSLADAGTWSVNGTPCTGNSAVVNPIEAYTLTYTYDTDSYFFVQSQPECFTKSPDEMGYVEFWETAPTEDLSSYAVELHP